MRSKVYLIFIIVGLLGCGLCADSKDKDKKEGSTPVSVADGEALNCQETAKTVQTWVVVLLVVPSLLNLASILLLVFSMILIRRLKAVVEAISSSTHWLTRTAIRVGLGPTAKKALIEYAKGKPEFKRLLG